MEIERKKEIKKAVREYYGKVARAGGVTIGSSPAASCCSPSEIYSKTDQAKSCGCAPPGD
jgi:hypothetical protein